MRPEKVGFGHLPNASWARNDLGCERLVLRPQIDLLRVQLPHRLLKRFDISQRATSGQG
jgi:hypothetical protein